MDTIILAVNVVMPLLLLMLTGLGARTAGILNDEIVKGLNKLIFMLLLPALMFINVYQTDVEAVLDAKLILYALGVTAVVFLISFKLVPVFEKENRKRGTMIQAMVRGNGAYFGIPVTVALIGEQFTGLMALVVALSAILYNITSVIAFETFRGEKIDYGRVVKGVVTNPMIIGTVAGLVMVLMNIELPALIFGAVKSVSSIATPLALITLGGSFVFTSARGYIKQITAGILVKLVIVPAIALPLAIRLGFENYEICCLFSLLAAPTAVATFAVAQQMDGDDVLAGQLVVLSSLASMITIFLGIIIFGPYMLMT